MADTTKINGYFVKDAAARSDISALQTMLSAILPAAWTSKAYAVGEVVLKDGKLYQANAATSTSWVPAQWTQVRIGNAAVLTYEEV